jgi:protein TonB
VRHFSGISQPMKWLDVAPVRPKGTGQTGVNALVIIEVEVLADGGVRNAKVVRSMPPFDEAALYAARQWRFEPALLDGVPVPVLLTATVTFPPGGGED